MIRKATPEDLPRCLNMGAAFHAYSPYRDILFDPAAFETFLLNLMEKGALLVSDTGMIAGVLSPLYFNPAYSLGAELLWWAPEGGGRELREAFEDWAEEQGAHAVQFSALADDQAERVAAIYAKAGYRPVETGYLKEL